MVLRLSAERIAGPPHPGKKGGAVGWHGREKGTVCLKERKLRVKRPRLRKKGQGEDGEVPIPAYEAMRSDEKLGSRMLEILLRGVSTRQYRAVLPEMAEAVGVSRSSVSREAREASEEELKRLWERRLEELDLLIIYLQGVIFGEHHVLVAVGVDAEGHKHMLGIAEGASENQVVAPGLLEDLVRRGVKPDRRRLFVIDGSKALRAAIDAVFGADHPLQRCRHHKLENVMGYLPEHLKDQTQAAMRSAFRLPAREGMARLEKQAEWLEREYPSAAASLREGLAEMFTVNRLGLSPSWARCLVGLHLEFAFGQQVLVERAQMRVEADRHQGGHIERAAEMAIAGFADARFFVDRAARGVFAGVESGRSHPLPHVQIGREHRQLGQDGDGAGGGDAGNAVQLLLHKEVFATSLCRKRIRHRGAASR